MLAAIVGAVMRGIIVDDFDIGRKPCARVGALDQVVAEQCVARKAAVEHSMEYRDLIDSLAGEAPLAEQVLVGVGNGARVNVEAALAGIDGRKARA